MSSEISGNLLHVPILRTSPRQFTLGVVPLFAQRALNPLLAVHFGFLSGRVVYLETEIAHLVSLCEFIARGTEQLFLAPFKLELHQLNFPSAALDKALTKHVVANFGLNNLRFRHGARSAARRRSSVDLTRLNAILLHQWLRDLLKGLLLKAGLLG